MTHLFSTIVDAIFGTDCPRNVPQARRQSHLGLEDLEGRSLPSVAPIFAVQAETAHVFSQPQVQDVANLQGYSFQLTSSNGKPGHQLVIQKETFNADGSASFTGTWKGEGPNSSGAGKPITGTISFNPSGQTLVDFSWKNGSGGENSFCGTLTQVYPKGPTAAAAYHAPEYFLSGVVHAATQGDGPGAVSGYSQAPQMVAKAS